MSDNSANVEKNIFGSLIVKGILMLILGILMMAFTFASIFVGETLAAVFLLLLGIALMTSGTTFFGEAKRTWWTIILGILVVILGICALIFPAVFALYLIYFIAAAALIGGITDLGLAIMGKSGSVNRGLMAVNGVLGIVLGVLFLLQPLMAAITIVQVGGIFLAAFGIMAIIEAFVFKKEAKTA